MNDPSEAAVVELKNTTDVPLNVSVTVGGVERHIVTLAPGEATRQITPSGVTWTFGPAPDDQGKIRDEGDGEEGEVDEDGGSKGGPRRFD